MCDSMGTAYIRSELFWITVPSDRTYTFRFKTSSDDGSQTESGFEVTVKCK